MGCLISKVKRGGKEKKAVTENQNEVTRKLDQIYNHLKEMSRTQRQAYQSETYSCTRIVFEIPDYETNNEITICLKRSATNASRENVAVSSQENLKEENNLKLNDTLNESNINGGEHLKVEISDSELNTVSKQSLKSENTLSSGTTNDSNIAAIEQNEMKCFDIADAEENGIKCSNISAGGQNEKKCSNVSDCKESGKSGSIITVDDENEIIYSTSVADSEIERVTCSAINDDEISEKKCSNITVSDENEKKYSNCVAGGETERIISCTAIHDNEESEKKCLNITVTDENELSCIAINADEESEKKCSNITVSDENERKYSNCVASGETKRIIPCTTIHADEESKKNCYNITVSDENERKYSNCIAGRETERMFSCTADCETNKKKCSNIAENAKMIVDFDDIYADEENKKKCSDIVSRMEIERKMLEMIANEGKENRYSKITAYEKDEIFCSETDGKYIFLSQTLGKHIKEYQSITDGLICKTSVSIIRQEYENMRSKSFRHCQNLLKYLQSHSEANMNENRSSGTGTGRNDISDNELDKEIALYLERSEARRSRENIAVYSQSGLIGNNILKQKETCIEFNFDVGKIIESLTSGIVSSSVHIEDKGIFAVFTKSNYLNKFTYGTPEDDQNISLPKLLQAKGMCSHSFKDIGIDLGVQEDRIENSTADTLFQVIGLEVNNNFTKKSLLFPGPRIVCDSLNRTEGNTTSSLIGFSLETDKNVKQTVSPKPFLVIRNGRFDFTAIGMDYISKPNLCVEIRMQLEEFCCVSIAKHLGMKLSHDKTLSGILHHCQTVVNLSNKRLNRWMYSYRCQVEQLADCNQKIVGQRTSVRHLDENLSNYPLAKQKVTNYKSVMKNRSDNYEIAIGSDEYKSQLSQEILLYQSRKTSLEFDCLTRERRRIYDIWNVMIGLYRLFIFYLLTAIYAEGFEALRKTRVLRANVVRMEYFESAMRESARIQTQLTFTNIYILDNRIPTAVPVYMQGFIHMKDLLRQA